MDTNRQYTAPAQRQQVVLPQPRRQPVAEEFAYRFRPLIDFGCAGIERMVSRSLDHNTTFDWLFDFRFGQ